MKNLKNFRRVIISLIIIASLNSCSSGISSVEKTILGDISHFSQINNFQNGEVNKESDKNQLAYQSNRRED